MKRSRAIGAKDTKYTRIVLEYFALIDQWLRAVKAVQQLKKSTPTRLLKRFLMIVKTIIKLAIQWPDTNPSFAE
jgi:hypothetical protein